MARVLVLVFGSVIAGAALAWQLGLWRLPDPHNPWAPLAVDAPPNWLTGWKLARATADPARCAAAVGALPGRLSPLPDRRVDAGCGWSGAWRVGGTATLRVGDAFALACPGVLALAMWERHTLQPAARQHFGEPIARLQHVGSYACRNVYGRENASRSRHATAEALDVTGFVLASGKRVSVSGGWGGDKAQAAFLRDAHDGACRWFDTVLGPDYNAAHRDHFHLETGGWQTCR